MPILKWDETNFMECLEVIPRVEDYETEHNYEVERNRVVLNVTVWQFDSVIQLSLRHQGTDNPMLDFALFVRGAVKYVRDKQGEYLEFQDCIIAPTRFSYKQMGNLFDKTMFSQGLTIQLSFKPDIQVRHLSN